LSHFSSPQHAYPPPHLPSFPTRRSSDLPKYDYQQPAVDAIKKYVEGGGHALFMLDPPTSLGREEVSPNAALGLTSSRPSEVGGSSMKRAWPPPSTYFLMASTAGCW